MTRALHFALDHALAVPIGAAVALVWAATLPDSYFLVSTSTSFWINDIGMAFFFAFAMQEVIETMLAGGALHTWRRATLPVVAAIGGSIGAVAVYELYVATTDEQILRAGWPIVCGVDAAFSYFLVKSLLRGKGGTAFVLLLAIASNAIGLVVIGFRAPLYEQPLAGVLVIAIAIIVCIGLARLRLRSFWPFLLFGGTLSWCGFAASGHGRISLPD